MYREYNSAGVSASYAQVLLLWLKLVHNVNLSWWAVFAPFWIGLTCIIVIGTIFSILLLWNLKNK